MPFQIITIKPENESLDLAALVRNNLVFFDIGDAMGSKSYPYTCTVIAGIDMEYKRIQGTKKNKLISVQVTAISRNGSCRFIILATEGKRPTLRRLAKEILRQLGFLPETDTSNINLILVAHNAIAEWSHFSDRDAPEVQKRLAYLRKSVVTDHPIPCRISPTSVAHVRIFDTMLLAPESRRSLENLADILGDDASRKIKIPKRYLKDMSQLLLDDPQLFIRYGIRDAELCLQLLLLMQRHTNMLVHGEVKEFFRTLAAPTVKMFLLQYPWVKDYLKQLEHHRFSAGLEMAKSAYHGGLNDSFYIGRTEREFLPGQYHFPDLDFQNCYPTALSLCCKLDASKKPDLITPRYQLDDMSREALKAENVSDEVLDKVGDALSKSQYAFERLLRTDNRCRRAARKLRYHCAVHQHRHLNSWRHSWEISRGLSLASKENFLIPGFAEVRFRFPDDVRYPTLFHPHPDYGLVYLREGEGVFTASEIMTAMDAGAAITVLSSVEFFIERDVDGAPIFMYQDFVRGLIEKRQEFEGLETVTGTVMAEIIKTFTNSVYGKIAQGINERLVYRPSAKCMVPIDRSAITEPVTAALITGAVRAALSSIFQSVAECNLNRAVDQQLVLISATTDGFILGIPNPTGLSAESYYSRDKDDLKLIKDKRIKPAISFLERYGCDDLVSRMNSQIPVKQLRAARWQLTDDPELLVIKNVVDEVISIKTRGQVGLLQSGDAPLLAMCGHKVPEGDLVDENGELPKGISSNNKKAAWVINHLDLREKSYGCDSEI